MAAYRTENFTLTGGGSPLHLHGAIVSAELFRVLRVKPKLGRAFLPEEDTPGAVSGTNAVILSNSLWQWRFGSNRNAVGLTINLDGKQYTIIGVMPASFQFPIRAAETDVWTTIAVDLTTYHGNKPLALQRGGHYLNVVARLKPKVTLGQAQAEMGAIVSALNQQYPENKPRGVAVVPELDHIVGDVRPALSLLLTSVACVLLIACANIAHLFLARSTTREKEMAIRAAMGASRGRVIRQTLTESCILALLGGLFGLILAFWGIALLKQVVPHNIPRIMQIGLDGRVLTFTALWSLLSGLSFGLAPALTSSRFHLFGSLKEGYQQSAGGQSRARNWLVTCEVAVALWLLVGAGLLVRSFLSLERVDPGFDPDHVLTFNVELPSRYSNAEGINFFRRAVDRISTLPGVRSASATVPLPLGGDTVNASFNLEG
jgi:putative ABC transport system permease protein